MSSTVGDATEAWVARYAGADREIYRQTLIELAQRDRRIYCLDSDMGGLETSFATALPDQYIDMGIAEANMMTVAAGLARAGKIPFVNTMAAFASARAYEQVKIDIAYNNLPVRIVATHSGLAAGYLGPTHHSCNDLAAMRVLPNLTVLTPADAVETVKMIEATTALPGPVYIRLGRRATELVYHADYRFEVGRAVELAPGDDLTLVAAGSYPVLAALGAHQLLRAQGIHARVLNMHTIKPLDVAALVRAAQETQGLVTIEDHSIIGGLGGAVAETLAEHAPARLRRIGVADSFCDRADDHRELLESYGVAPATVAAAARELIESGRAVARPELARTADGCGCELGRAAGASI